MRLLVELHGLSPLSTTGPNLEHRLALLASVTRQRGDNDVIVMLCETNSPADLLAARETLRPYVDARDIVVAPLPPAAGDAYDPQRRLAARETTIASLAPDSVLLVDPPPQGSDVKFSADRSLHSPVTIAATDSPYSLDPTGFNLVVTSSDPDESARRVWEFTTAARESQTLPRPPGRNSLALVSPWPPARSGIADFAASTLRHLCRRYDVTVVTDSPWTDDRVPHMSRDTFRRDWWRYDRVLYHVGNNAYHADDLEMLGEAPGAVVVHDAVLGGAIRSAVHAFGHPGGVQSLLAWDGPDPRPGQPDLRGTRAALAPALGILVHSEHARELLREAGMLTPTLHVSPLPVTRAERESHRPDAAHRSGAPILTHFGFVNAFKGAAELVEAAGWLARHDLVCRVAFVGEFLDRPLKRTVTQLAETLGVPLEITGFVTPDEWTRWLETSACAVQLRQQSHGESSAALGQLLVAGLPVVCTATGSFAELPEGVVRHVPQGVTGTELAEVIAEVLKPAVSGSLGRAGQRYAATTLSPERWADAVATMVEESYARNPGLLWAEAVADLPPVPAPQLHFVPSRTPDAAVWLSDTSVYAHTPFFSGIQRVTLGLHRELLQQTSAEGLHPTSLVEEPPDDPHPEIARDRLLSKVRMPLDEADWLLCLDLDVRLARIRDQLLTARARGLRVAVNIYDLMPVLHPEWFPRESGPDGFAPWLRVMLETADLVLVNSISTADHLRDWVRDNPPQRVDSFDLALLRLGSEFSVVAPAEQSAVRSRSHFLVVGTIEPRKGHAAVLDAFEQMWARGSPARLTVVGRPGWMVDAVVRRLTRLEADDDRFCWNQNATDEELQDLYARCTAVVMASEGEGFGLPIIEAAAHGCPVVVRDLPVFRELAGDTARYFRADGTDLVSVLERSLTAAESGELTAPSTEHIRPWRDVAERLRSLLGGREPMLDTWSPGDKGWRGDSTRQGDDGVPALGR